jgi:hypothetical protein
LSAVLVAVDATSAQLGGGLSFVLNQLPRLEDELDLVVFAQPSAAAALRPVLRRSEVRVTPRWTGSLAARAAWQQSWLAAAVVRAGADVLYATGNLPLLAVPRPQVVVLQNIYLFGPEGPALLAAAGAAPRLRMTVRLQRRLLAIGRPRVTAAIAISESLARVAEREGFRPHVVRLGAPPPLDDRGAPAGVPYAVAVANDYPHKRLRQLAAMWPAGAPELRLVGASYTTRDRASLAAAVASRPNVTWLGPVGDRDRLFDLYRGAAVCVVHSSLEAFGVTILEAMAAGAPVVAADLAAHREAAGDAATYYAPDDAADLARAVGMVVDHPRHRDRLVELGRKRLTAFDWGESAARTAEILTASSRAGTGPG